jgi:EAL domain-containing protein (putative c-di-GMP-specific phosphodiesterase class I)/DICT domain-containing protein
MPTFAFDELLDRRNLTPQYQPIFDLGTHEQVAAEALARWPDLDIDPTTAFQWAAQVGRLAELDEACSNAAVDDAIAHGMPPGFQLFVNLEPSVVGPATATRLLARTRGQVGLNVEITERALLNSPAELLRAIHQLRAAGCAIALDDVGAVPDTLALLPFVAPDVIKLDVSLIERWPNLAQAAIYTTVAAHAERSGATVLAEGIETDVRLQRAIALGATLGQGWALGWPGPLGALTSPGHTLRPRHPVALTPASPFSLVHPSAVQIGPKHLLLGLSEHLEHQGLALETPPVVLGAFQQARYFTSDTAHRYSRLASRCPLVAALGAGLSPEPTLGVRGASLSADDPLCGEWVIAVVGAHYAGALIAHDLGDTGPDRDRRFAFTLTHDYVTVLAAARSLLDRVTTASSFPDLQRADLPTPVGTSSR